MALFAIPLRGSLHYPISAGQGHGEPAITENNVVKEDDMPPGESLNSVDGPFKLHCIKVPNALEKGVAVAEIAPVRDPASEVQSMIG